MLPLLYISWIACLMYSYGSGVSGYITPFATMELGQSIHFGAQLGMCLGLGGILCSLILGWINAITTTIGYLLMFISYKTPNIAYIASFVVGLGMSMYTVQCPLMTRSIVGSRHYSDIWSILMVANSLIGGGLYSSIGLFYDKLGSYSGAFTMAIALYIGACIIGFIAISLGEKYRTNHPEFKHEKA